MGPLLPRGWLLLPLRAKVDDDSDDGSQEEMVVGPDGNPMRAPKKSGMGAARRAAAARIAALCLLHGAERERCMRLDAATEGERSQPTQPTQPTPQAGHPGETALSLLYLAMCPSSVLFAPPILAHFEPLAKLLAQRAPNAIVRGAARIGCVHHSLSRTRSLAPALAPALALHSPRAPSSLPPSSRPPHSYSRLAHELTTHRVDDFYRLSQGVADAFVEQSYGHAACARCVLMLLHAQLEPRCRAAVLKKLVDSNVLRHFPLAVAARTRAAILSPPESDSSVLKAWQNLACAADAGFVPTTAPLVCSIGTRRLREHIFGPFRDFPEKAAAAAAPLTLSFGRSTMLRQLKRGASATVFAALCDAEEGDEVERGRMVRFAAAIAEACA